MTATLVTYLRAVEGQVPDPAWEARLASLSGKFGELKERARIRARERAAAVGPGSGSDPGSGLSRCWRLRPTPAAAVLRCARPASGCCCFFCP
jgi:hypothetical protein